MTASTLIPAPDARAARVMDLAVSGVTCARRVRRVEQAICAVPGARGMVLTGDNRGSARAAASALGVTKVLSEGKAEAVTGLNRTVGGQAVAMAGDGVNEAPALVAADVGIAMAPGASMAAEAAGVAPTGDLRLLPAGLDHSSPKVVRAAIALGSFSVVADALLLRRWRP